MPPAKFQRILIRGVNWLGDAVMTMPAIQRLSEAHPEAEITMFTHGKFKDLWHLNRSIDRLKTFVEAEGTFGPVRELRREKFNLAVVLPNSPRSAFQMWLAGIPTRIGYANAGRNFFLTQAVPPRPGAVTMHKRSVDEIKRLIERGSPDAPPSVSAHHIFNYLHLVAAVGGNPEPVAPQLNISDASVAQFVAKFKLGASALPWIAINPGAEYGPAKRWPEERFIEAAIQIQQRVKCRWLILGLKGDGEIADRMAEKIARAGNVQYAREETGSPPRVFNLAGLTSLGELLAALKLCRVLLTNDSGPMHVAAALGTPVVVPFGSTSPELTGPGLPGDKRHHLLRANAACSPCFLRECPIDFRCMTGITVEAVTKAVLEALG